MALESTALLPLQNLPPSAARQRSSLPPQLKVAAPPLSSYLRPLVCFITPGMQMYTLWQVEAIYMRFAPQKLGKVGKLLEMYAGDEDKLLRLVRRKYVDAGNILDFNSIDVQ